MKIGQGGSHEIHAGDEHTDNARKYAGKYSRDCHDVDRGDAAPLPGLIEDELISGISVDNAGIGHSENGQRTDWVADAWVQDLNSALSDWGGSGCRAVEGPYTRDYLQPVDMVGDSSRAEQRDTGLVRLGRRCGGSLTEDELRRLRDRIRSNLIAASVHVAEKHANRLSPPMVTVCKGGTRCFSWGRCGQAQHKQYASDGAPRGMRMCAPLEARGIRTTELGSNRTPCVKHSVSR